MPINIKKVIRPKIPVSDKALKYSLCAFPPSPNFVEIIVLSSDLGKKNTQTDKFLDQSHKLVFH